MSRPLIVSIPHKFGRQPDVPDGVDFGICHRDLPPRLLRPAPAAIPSRLLHRLKSNALSTLPGGSGLLVGSATAGSRVRSTVIALLRGMLASMLLGLMMADHSAGPSPQQAVMAGIMPGDPADYRTFQTAGGGRWGRARRDRSYCQGHCRRDQDCSSPAVTSSARHGTGWAGADTAFPSASMVT